jgi:excisionase family DNA binding protein
MAASEQERIDFWAPSYLRHEVLDRKANEHWTLFWDGEADLGEFWNSFGTKTAAHFLGISASLIYAYVERKQIPHFRMMGRSIRFRLSELDRWRQQFHVNGGINE